MIPHDISSIQDVRRLAEQLSYEHLTNKSYTDIDSIRDRRFYTKSQAEFREDLISKSWELCDKLEIDLYELCDIIHIRIAKKIFASQM